MNKKYLNLAAYMLEMSSDIFSNHGCNDWDYPKDWTEKEKQDFCLEYHEYNGDPEEYNPKHPILPDFAVMNFLAYVLRKQDG